jgi:hypothetical protein
MPYDIVQVVFQLATTGPGLPLGRLTFEVSDFVMDTTTGALLIVPPVVLNYTGGNFDSPIMADFLATDSQNVTHNWTWLLTAEISDRVSPLPKHSFTISIANGAQQSFAAIAATSTIVPS